MDEQQPVREKSSNWLNVPIAILVAGLMVSLSILYTNGGVASINKGVGAVTPTPSDQSAVIQDPSTLIGQNSPTLGSPSARVTMVEFTDFQCPFCRSFFEDTFGQLKKDYIDTGKVRLVFRDYPLPFHPAAHISAEAGDCALEQGKFWQFHDKVFGEQAKQGQGTISYAETDLKNWAQQIGLDMTKFNSCLDSHKYSAQVDADTQAGNAAGVDGTPTFYINGHQLVGALPYSSFQQAIDAALK